MKVWLTSDHSAVGFYPKAGPPEAIAARASISTGIPVPCAEYLKRVYMYSIPMICIYLFIHLSNIYMYTTYFYMCMYIHAPRAAAPCWQLFIPDYGAFRCIYLSTRSWMHLTCSKLAQSHPYPRSSEDLEAPAEQKADLDSCLHIKLQANVVQYVIIGHIRTYSNAYEPALLY